MKIIKASRLLSIFSLLASPLVVHATEYRVVEQPRQVCWNERMAVQSPGYGGALIGGIAGGLLGNQVGGGTGRTVATALGAVTGAMVGERMSTGAHSYQTVQRCHTVMDKARVPVVYKTAPIIYGRRPVVQQGYYAQRETYRQRGHWVQSRRASDGYGYRYRD
jgi:uncharacterized protein YcfJ